MLRIISPKPQVTPFAKSAQTPLFDDVPIFSVLPPSDLEASDDIFVYPVNSISPSDWHQVVQAHIEEFSVQSGPVMIILDCSYEGPIVSVGDAKAIEAVVLSHPDKVKCVICLSQNINAVNTIENAKAEGVFGLYYHSFLHTVASGFSVIFRNKAVYKDYIKSKFPAKSNQYEKRYTCLINQARPHRIAIFGWLAEQGVLDRGNVSFYGAYHASSEELLTKNINVARQRFPKFNSGIDRFENQFVSQLPFANFEETSSANFLTSFNITSFKTTPMSLVVESEMSTGGIQRFTEKSLKPMLAGHLIMIAGNPHVHFLLRKHGLAPTGFDYSYDKVLNPEDRLLQIFDQFSKFLDLTDIEVRDLMIENWMDLHENIEQFQTAAHAVLKTSLEKLDEIIRQNRN